MTLAPEPPPTRSTGVRRLRAVSTDPPFDSPELDPALAVVLPLQLPGGGPSGSVPARRTAALQPAQTGVVAPLERPGSRRERAVDAELRRLFGVRRNTRAEMPDPAPRAAATVRALLEVFAGHRPARQLTGWVTPELLEALEHRAARTGRPGPAASLRSLRCSEPGEAVVEVSAVIDAGARCRALALRLEALDGRWTATALRVG